MRQHSASTVLRYTDGKRNNTAARRHYLRWRKAQSPPIPDRCDDANCQFHTAPLVWQDRPLPLILEHINGVNSDNRVSNLRFLCPNCDAQNSATRGGANRGRVEKSAGGFALSRLDGSKDYVMPVEPGHAVAVGCNVLLHGPDGPR
jgi:hypothetical protein